MEIFGIDIRWHDPSFWGWVIFAGYLATAGIAFGAGRVQGLREGAPRRLEWFWYALAIALVALAINKQLDLHEYASDFAERTARSGGWYGQRRAVQELFILGVFGGGLTLVLGLLIAFRRATLQHWLAIAGVIALLGFIAIRAASLHDVDALLRTHVRITTNLNVALEVSGIVVIAVASAWAALRARGLARAMRPAR